MRTKYKVTFYKLDGPKFFRICTRTYMSTLKFAIRTAIKQKAVFSILRYKNKTLN